MNLFSSVRYCKDQLKARRMKYEGILVSPVGVARPYLYSVEYDGKHYLLVNEHELHRAIASLPSGTIDRINATEQIMGIPIIRSKQKIENVMKGVFTWASRL